jgi:hypothetical protein
MPPPPTVLPGRPAAVAEALQGPMSETMAALARYRANALITAPVPEGSIRIGRDMLTGHTSDRSLEIYLRGVKRYPLARAAQEALADQFAPLLEAAQDNGNRRKFSGVTGRASGKSLANGKSDQREKALTD